MIKIKVAKETNQQAPPRGMVPLSQTMHPLSSHSWQLNANWQGKHYPNTLSKADPCMHFESIEYFFTSPNWIGWLILEAIFAKGFKISKRLSYLDKSLKAFTRPPVSPITVFSMETSAQDVENLVYPVHWHFPFMHTPFLLQW